MTEETNSTIIHISDVKQSEEMLTKLLQPQRIRFFLIKMKRLCCTSIIDNVLFMWNNPVFRTFTTAYDNHYPITLSPDIVWLLILQGFSRYVNNYSEELKKQFVDFEGKKELLLHSDIDPITSTREDWEKIFSEFSEQIAANVGKDLVNELTPNFTTTTQTSLTACQVTIMNIFKKYFKYTVRNGTCGIPYVILEGSVEDWYKVKEKLQVLSKYGYLSEERGLNGNELFTILDEFINAKEGKINQKFWKKMVLGTCEKGCCYYSPNNKIEWDGWFKKLFPCTFDHPTKELFKCPLKYVKGDTTYDLSLYSGFIGAKQDPKTFALKPEIGWFVAYDPKK